jgi:tetratricopeptide (TPR) repeat protein
MAITKKELDEAIHSIQDKACQSLTDFLVSNSPELADSKELKEAVLEALDTSNEQKRIESAFVSIADYLHRHSFPVETKEINDNWVEAFNKFTKLLMGKEEIKEGTPSSQPEDLMQPLQTIIGIAPKTYEIFYACGLDLYKHDAFEKAADVFFLLTILNYCYSSVWIALGLSEQKCGHFELALKAYAMGAITHIESPEPFFCAADCCIAMNDPHEARIYLDEGMERLNKNREFESFRGQAQRISQLLVK